MNDHEPPKTLWSVLDEYLLEVVFIIIPSMALIGIIVGLSY